MAVHEVCSEFEDPAGESGYIVQRWDDITATYMMVDALMTGTRWIPHEPPLVPGKGVPAFTYMTIRAMKQLGVELGALRGLVVCGNHHVKSVLQLARAERNGISIADGVLKTTSYLSVETPMIQTAHRIRSVCVVGGTRDRLANLLEWHVSGGSPRRREIGRDRTAEHEELLARFSMTRDDVVLFDYELHLELEPLSSTTETTSWTERLRRWLFGSRG